MLEACRGQQGAVHECSQRHVGRGNHMIRKLLNDGRDGQRTWREDAVLYGGVHGASPGRGYEVNGP